MVQLKPASHPASLIPIRPAILAIPTFGMYSDVFRHDLTKRAERQASADHAATQVQRRRRQQAQAGCHDGRKWLWPIRCTGLLRKICAGQIESGQPSLQVASYPPSSSCEISSTPLATRSAMQSRLSFSLGLVVTRPGPGTFVTRADRPVCHHAVRGRRERLRGR